MLLEIRRVYFVFCQWLQGDMNVRGRAVAGVLWLAFLLLGVWGAAHGASRPWLHVAASGWFWSWGWLATGNPRIAFAFAVVPSLVWEAIQQPAQRAAWQIDFSHLAADASGMSLAWVILSAVQRSPIGWRPSFGSQPH